MNWDPKKALRVDRARKHQKESRKIDYRDMNDYDLEDDDSQYDKRRRNNSDD